MNYNQELTERIRRGKAAFEFNYIRKDESIEVFKILFPLDFRCKKNAFIGYKYYFIEKDKLVATATDYTTLPVLTLEELLLPEKEIIGYVLKEECKQYEEAACKVAGLCSNTFMKSSDGSQFISGSHAHEKITAAGVLDLWFNPVYKKDEFKVGQIAKKTWKHDNDVDFFEIAGVSEIGLFSKNYFRGKREMTDDGEPHKFSNAAWVLSIASPSEISAYQAAKKAAERIMIGEYEVAVDDLGATIKGVHYFASELKVLRDLMKKGQIKSLNCGCSGQIKVDLPTIEKIISRIKSAIMENYKDNCTKGKVFVKKNYEGENEIFVANNSAAIALFYQSNSAVNSRVYATANAILFKEALNTLNTTGLTPLELVDQVKTLREALQWIEHHALQSTCEKTSLKSVALAALAKTEPIK